MKLYGPDNSIYYYSSFDKKRINHLYKQIIFCLNNTIYDDGEYNYYVLGEYYCGNLTGGYYRKDDRIHIEILAANRECDYGIYNVHIFHMNLRTMDPGYYRSTKPRYGMDYYTCIKKMKLKIGMKRVNNFKRPLFIFDNIID